MSLFLARQDKERWGIRHAFTADYHFLQAGFEALLVRE
ncbi:MAG: hypothetical protein IMHGJWDQ_001297 [Candidatus Fervidibacter sp.]